MLFQKIGNGKRVLANSVHTQSQGFNALQNLEGIKRRQCRTGVAQWHHTGTSDVGGGAQGFGIHHAMIGGVWLIQARKAFFVFGPWEFTRIDNNATECGAMPAQVFSQRMHHNVSAEFKRAQQVWCCHGIVNDQRHAMAMGNFGDGFDVGDITQWIAD